MQDDEMYEKLSEYFGSCKKTNELMSDIENEYIELINTEQAQKEYILLSVRLPDHTPRNLQSYCHMKKCGGARLEKLTEKAARSGIKIYPIIKK